MRDEGRAQVDSRHAMPPARRSISRTKQSSDFMCRLKAKFQTTGPIGPDRTCADPHGLFCGPGLRETPFGPCGSPTKSVRVRAGPRGSGRVLSACRARVVEFSYNRFLSVPDLRGAGRAGTEPPTNRGPPAKPFIFISR